MQNLMGLPAIMLIERGPKDHVRVLRQGQVRPGGRGQGPLVANYDDELFDDPEDDDSWSYNLTIPVALMKRTDADKIIQAYDEDPLLIEHELDEQHPPGRQGGGVLDQ